MKPSKPGRRVEAARQLVREFLVAERRARALESRLDATCYRAAEELVGLKPGDMVRTIKPTELFGLSDGHDKVLKADLTLEVLCVNFAVPEGVLDRYPRVMIRLQYNPGPYAMYVEGTAKELRSKLEKVP